jgi:hypothetical protein
VDIFPFVVGHESDRRKRRTLLTTSPAFCERKTVRSNQKRARRKSAASDQATREYGAKTPQVRQSGLESPPVIYPPWRESLPSLGKSSPTCRECSGNGMPSGADPRNGLGRANPTAVQSGNRHASLLGERSRRRQSRSNRLCESAAPCGFMLMEPRRAQAQEQVA